MTTATQLTEVRAAISAVLTTGQSVRFGDRQVTHADLGELRVMEEKLQARATAEANAKTKRGRNRVSYVVPD